MPPTLRLTNQVLFFMFLVLFLVRFVSSGTDCALVSVQRNQSYISPNCCVLIDIHQGYKPMGLITRQVRRGRSSFLPNF